MRYDMEDHALNFEELKGYLEPLFSEIRASLKTANSSIAEIKSDVHKMDEDLRKLEQRNAVQDHRLDEIDKLHDKQDTHKRWGAEMWIISIIALAGIALNIFI
jgi:chromosome segregation ATPase